MDVSSLPHVNALLNALSSVFIVLGYVFIRRGDREAHKRSMIAALVVSGVFLITYLTYHFNSGLAKFGGEGMARPIYFTILIAHVLLAMVITPLIPWAVLHAIKGRGERHRRLVRWVLPMWLYVTVSGVVVYVMAIWLYPWSNG